MGLYKRTGIGSHGYCFAYCTGFAKPAKNFSSCLPSRPAARAFSSRSGRFCAVASSIRSRRHLLISAWFPPISTPGVAGLVLCIACLALVHLWSGVRLHGRVSEGWFYSACHAFLALTGGLTYAEMGAMFPRSGGVYVFLKEAYGPLPAFLYGWAALLVVVAGSLAGEYLAERAQRGSRKRFDRALKKVRDGAPDPGDEL